MLIAYPTPHGTGITLWGDFFDLEELYSILLELIDDDEHPGDTAELYFRYEIRKARDGQRESKYFEVGEEKVRYLGTQLYWTYYIPALKLLRTTANEINADESTQSMLYKLEAVLFSALTSFYSTNGNIIWNWYKSNSIEKTDYLDLLIEHITYQCLTQPDGAKRFNHILPALESLSKNHPENIRFRKLMDSYSKKLNCPLRELDLNNDFESLSYKW